jgi:hypothetical protein
MLIVLEFPEILFHIPQYIWCMTLILYQEAEIYKGLYILFEMDIQAVGQGSDIEVLRRECPEYPDPDPSSPFLDIA